MTDDQLQKRIGSLFTDIEKPATDPQRELPAIHNEPEAEITENAAEVWDALPRRASSEASREAGSTDHIWSTILYPNDQENRMNKSGPSNTLNTIQSFRKRRQSRGPMLLYILAAVLVVAGVIVLALWLTGPSKPLNAIFATDTPTPTMTFTPTNTATPTMTFTETATPTITNTPTPSAPFEYIVQEGDYLATIVDKFQLGTDGLQLIFLLNPYTSDGVNYSINPTTQVIYPGQKIWIPNPGMPLPTATPIPANLPRGTKLTYIIQPGDTLASIADKFNSTIDAIVAENKITNPNSLFVGQQLTIPANIVTATATRPPTSTPGTAVPPSIYGTSTPTETKTP